MIRHVARAAVVIGALASVALVWRLSVAYATEMDRADVSWFGVLFWGGLICAAAGTWGVLALRRLGTKDWWLLPFEAFAVLSFVVYLVGFAYLRIPPFRTAFYTFMRTSMIWGMSREVPVERRNLPSQKP